MCNVSIKGFIKYPMKKKYGVKRREKKIRSIKRNLCFICMIKPDKEDAVNDGNNQVKHGRYH